MQDAADMELLRQYADRNSDEAFAALVTRYVNMVYSAALRKTGNASAAEEITQAVFVILAKKAGRLRDGTILSGWLYQTARLTSASFLRTEVRRVRREQEAYMQSLSNETESEVWPQIAPLLEDAMGKLSEKERNAIALRFFEEKSFQEIGTAVGASENAAKKRVAYALEKLRRFFLKHGIVSTVALIGGAISANSVQAAPAILAKSITAVAIAKGVAATGSTLTLIKGALKIMAWTKAKTAIIVGVGVLLVVSFTPTVWYYHLAPDSWRHRFEATYQLKKGETVRYVKEPYIPERAEYFRWKEPDLAAMARGQPTQMLFHQDADGLWPQSVGWGPPQSHSLKSMLRYEFNLKQYGFEGSDTLLNLNVHGDWIIREGLGRESLLAGLAPVLRKVTGHDIRFEKRTVERPVVVVRGRLEAGQKKPIQIYAENSKDAGLAAGGTFKTFLEETGDKLNIRLIDETQVDAPSSQADKIAWVYHGDANLSRMGDRRAELSDKVFKNLAGQTGLSFTREQRPVEVWFVTGQP